ncbi:hypothetical protein SAMN02745181_1966 [Rubritalea squalenifaciens DSM 18772]|uniref:Uncharacterized protein n=1 Tax=Rubritalea squalenifaciens DSM 18772 TaxID=1123071 RepID=A0A1M6J075_9BACT|nr:hypothetical protein SAMN02745181_1966 [Rubritalea squalenifaciens DSM 18772]
MVGSLSCLTVLAPHCDRRDKLSNPQPLPAHLSSAELKSPDNKANGSLEPFASS